MRRAAMLVSILLALLPAAPDGRAAEPVLPFDEELECLEPVPAAVSPVPPPVDRRAPVVDVLLLLDGTTHEDAVAAARDASVAYRRAGMKLRVHLGRIRVPADGTHRGYGGLRFTASTDRMMAAAKAAVGERRPPGIDVVYVFTSKDLYLGADERDPSYRNYGVVGLADCIGGIRFPHRAFAVGERLPSPPTLGPVAVAPHLSGKVLAHEIGHLLGAHHHAASCAEPVPSAVVDRSADVCSLMINDAALAALRFSALNGAVVRGHALDHG